MSSIPVPPAFPDHELAAEDSKAARVVQDDNNSSEQESIDLQKEIYDTSAIDPILAKKMALTNNAIDEIGMTPWQWKLFCLNGFGYAVDSVKTPRIPEDFQGTDTFDSVAAYRMPVDRAASCDTRIRKP